MSPSPAEHTRALFSPPSCGIFSIANSLGYCSIENPHLNEPGAIIAFRVKHAG